MLARLYVFNKESTMTIDRQSIVYFINEKGGLALAAEVIHLTYMYTSGGWRVLGGGLWS